MNKKQIVKVSKDVRSLQSLIEKTMPYECSRAKDRLVKTPMEKVEKK
jgi:hypothetical protein